MFRKQYKINELVSAARFGKEREVRRWVEKGVPVDGVEVIPGRQGRTALEAALSFYNNTIAEYLVVRGATVTETALAYTVRQNNLPFIEFLHKQDISVLPALEKILLSGNERMLEIAREQGADLKEALEEAALTGQEESVCFLVDQKTEVTAKALENARQGGNKAIAELLGMVRDPDETKAWLEKQRILEEGAIEEKARLKVREMEQAAQDMCAADDAEKQERLAKLRQVVGDLEKGLNILQQSPHVDFAYTVKIDEKAENAVVKTNIEGKLLPLRLEISAEDPDTITEYTGDDEGYQLDGYKYYMDFLGIKLVVREFDDVGEAVNDVIELAFAKNAVKPEKTKKPASQTVKKKRGRTP